MTLAPLLALCPAGFEITLADVGSAGGIKQRWRAARPVVRGLLFEPRDGDQPRSQGPDTLYPVALGPAAGSATLNVTALPNMSSTLLPNAGLLAGFRKKGAHTRIVDAMEMRVDTLDAVAARHGRPIDAIKVDTQGSELGILQGAAGVLGESVILAEIEVSFFERYAGQALFGDIAAFMTRAGFDLIDLYRLKRYRHLNAAGLFNVGLGGGARPGRLAYGDAIFFIGEARLLARMDALPCADAETLALKAIVALLVYGKGDAAARLFDRARGHFDPARADKVAGYFARLRGRGLHRGGLHRIFDYLARNV